MNYVEEICTKFGLDKYGDVPLVKKASQATGQPHHLIVFAIAVVLILSCLSPPGQWICSVVFTFLLPAYLSYKAIESSDHQDDQKWLTYWIVFAFNYCFEDVIFGLLFWVPMLSLIRTAFLVYLFVSKDKGTEFVFKAYVRPAFSKVEEICGGWIEAFESFTGLDGSYSK